MAKRRIDCFTYAAAPIDFGLMASSPAYQKIMQPVLERWIEAMADGRVQVERTVIEYDDQDPRFRPRERKR